MLEAGRGGSANSSVSATRNQVDGYLERYLIATFSAVNNPREALDILEDVEGDEQNADDWSEPKWGQDCAAV